MGWLFYLLLVVAFVLSLCLMVLVHAGFFYDLRIRTTTPLSLPGHIAYKLYRGAYSNAGAGFKELMSLAPHNQSFGIYYDNPNEVPQAELRYIIGCSLSSTSPSGSPSASSRPATPTPQALAEAGYKTWTFPKCTNAVVTEFPYRSLLSLIIAPRCVYPALTKYFKTFQLPDAGPVIEICESDCIKYIAPLENNEGFFVPEVSELGKTKKD